MQPIFEDAPAEALIDAPVAPANDLPGNPTDITAGGTFTEDVRYAHDDNLPPLHGAGCGLPGGRDVYFSITPTANEVYDIDTFGSDYDTVIRVFHGLTCAAVAPQMQASCRNDECSGSQSQYVGTIGPGDNCVVVDQSSGAETNGQLVLNVEHAGRDGRRITSGAMLTGNTCNTSNATSSTVCGGGGNDDAFYWVGCPGVTSNVTATTCNAATVFDTQVYALGPGAIELGCNDNDAACTATATGASTMTAMFSDAHLFWVIVDSGAPATCGAYSVTFTVN